MTLAIAHATGGGRDGHVRSDDDRLDLDRTYSNASCGTIEVTLGLDN